MVSDRVDNLTDDDFVKSVDVVKRREKMKSKKKRDDGK